MLMVAVIFTEEAAGGALKAHALEIVGQGIAAPAVGSHTGVVMEPVRSATYRKASM